MLVDAIVTIAITLVASALASEIAITVSDTKLAAKRYF